MARTRPLLAGAVTAVSIVLALSACSGDDDDGPSITVYNAQHEELLDEIAPGFTEETGIEVDLRNGDDFELANQLVQEGSASPADVFLTENSPAMSLVDSEGLFAPLDPETLSAGAGAVRAGQRPLDRFRRPFDGPGLQHRPGR